MDVVDWNSCAKEWSHLKGLPFPKMGPRPIVDILIGLDCADLHYSYRDIRGKPGQPIARLTPLGWTCVGALHNLPQSRLSTHFAKLTSLQRIQILLVHTMTILENIFKKAMLEGWNQLINNL